MTEDIKEKISKAKIGKNTGKDNCMYGKTHSEETKRKIGDREYKTGEDHVKSRKVICIETGEIFSYVGGANVKHINRAITTNKSAGGYHWQYLDEYDSTKIYEKAQQTIRPVRCIETGEIFDSISNAAKSCGKTGSGHISMVCRGKKKKAYGYTWEYVENKE